MKCWNPLCDYTDLTASAITCPRCGFDRPSRPGNDQAGSSDPEPHRCAHLENGIRCAGTGSLSMSTMNRGPSGKEPPSPFFCHRHFPPFLGRNLPHKAPPGGFQSVRQALKFREPGEEG